MTASKKSAPRTAVLAANSAWNLLNFRRPLVEALTSAGWRVVAVAGDDGYADAIRSLGAEFVPVRVDSSGTSVLRDARLFADYLAILRTLRPSAFLGFTVKPNIYGSLAAGLLGVRVINNISGLGTAFLRPGPLNWLVSRLYKLALRKSARVFFQNPHDLEMFVARGLVRPGQAERIPGSGIDLDHFRAAPARRVARGALRFLFVGRLLRDKGLAEYAEAARLLKPKWPEAQFAILGFAGSDNRSAVPIAEVERWQDENIVTYLGETGDVRPFLADADCIVLPSYREGMPRSLLEASALGRPMIATDVPGCRDIVKSGVNGFLCEVRSPQSLASAMEKMLEMGDDDRAEMGLQARRTVERGFGQSVVVKAYLDALK